MSEEEMIDITEKIANFGWSDYDDFEINKKAIQGLLDLYNKEKEKNKKLIMFKNKMLNFIEDDLCDIYNLGILVERYSKNEINKEVYIDNLQNFLTIIDKFYIPKSKVQDEISYLTQKYDLEEDYINYETVIKILQELLEEGE